MGICNVGCMFYNEHEKRGPIEKMHKIPRLLAKIPVWLTALEIIIILLMLHLSFAALNLRF